MARQPSKIRITREFVDYWSARFDVKYARDEVRLKRWLAQDKNPRPLDSEHFMDLAMWKSPRPKRYYERNSDAFIRQVTKHAFQASDGRLQLHILMALEGVGVPVASAILHFAFPDTYPIMDVRVLRTLRRAGLWRRDEARSFTTAGWLEYVQSMREHSQEVQVDLRDLEKALWAFDKYGGRPREGASS